jgi:hypothetical protein
LTLAYGRRPSSWYRSALPGETVRELAERLVFAAPVVADGIAVLAVPFAPPHGEVANLIAAAAEIPRLGDQLHALQRRILMHDVEKSRQTIDVIELAASVEARSKRNPSTCISRTQ